MFSKLKQTLMQENSIKKLNEKLKGRIKTYNILGSFFLIIQVIGYLSKINENSASFQRPFAFYIGFNLWIIIALIFFIRAASIRSKMESNQNKS